MARKGGNPEGLKPFVKGEDPRRCTSGKKKLPLKEALEAALGELGIEEITKKLIELAKKGDLKAIDMFMDRYYGKVSQPIEHDIPEGLSITIVKRVPDGS